MHYEGNKTLTSMAKSCDILPPALQIEKVNQATEDIKRLLTSTQSPKDSPVIIPPAASGSNAVLEEASQQLVVLQGDLNEDKPDQGKMSKRR